MNRSTSGHAMQFKLFSDSAPPPPATPSAWHPPRQATTVAPPPAACCLHTADAHWSDDNITVRLGGRDYPCRITRRRGAMSLRLNGASIKLGCAPSESYSRLSGFVSHSRQWLTEQISSSVDFYPPRDEQGCVQLLVGGKLCTLLLTPQASMGFANAHPTISTSSAHPTSSAPVVGSTASVSPHISASAVAAVGAADISCVDGRLLLAYADRAQASAALLDWMRDRTRVMVETFLPAYAGIVGANFERLRVAHYKGQWGSCRRTRQGVYNLSFNARLAMMPDWVGKYVLLHELCHCRIFDHSPRFWQLLDKYCLRLLHCTSREARQWHTQHDAFLRTDITHLVNLAARA